MYKLVIFDIDGTLLNTEIAVLKGLQKCLKVHHNIDVDTNDLLFAVGMPGDEVFAHFNIYDDGFSYSRWIKYIDDFKDDISIYDGILETLKGLKKNNVLLAIATSKTRHEYETTVKSFGMNSYFDYVVTIDEVENPKPSPDPLLKICSLAGMDVGDAVFLGDTKFDIECAKNANMDFGLALWGAHDKCKKLCDRHFSNPQDLLKSNADKIVI